MLTVTDARTGSRVPITSARPGLLTVRVHLAGADGAAGPADLRALVVADVLRRVVESAGRQVLHMIDRPDPSAPAAGLERQAAALGVAPPADAWPLPGGSADLLVLADGAARPDPADGVQLATGAVHGWEPESGEPEPAALRLALLRHPHADPAPLGPERLAAAAAVLREWRQGVARWSREPSKPLPGELKASATEALGRDLDTAAVLDLLDHVAEAPGFAPGGRFEVFAYLDRFLALELARDIGAG